MTMKIKFLKEMELSIDGDEDDEVLLLTITSSFLSDENHPPIALSF